MQKFEPGQKVRVKSFKDIQRIHPYQIPYGFMGSMHRFTNEVVTIRRCYVDDRVSPLGWCLIFEEDINRYSWHSSCVDPLEEDVTNKVCTEIKRLFA